MPSDVVPHGGEQARVLVRRCFVGTTSVGEVTSRGHDTRVTEPAGATLIIPCRGRIVSIGPDGTPRAASSGGAVFFSPNRRDTRVEPDGSGAFFGVPLIVAHEDLRDAALRLGLPARALRTLDRFAIEMARTGSPEAEALVNLGLELYEAVSCEDARLRRPAAHRSISRSLADRMIGVLSASDLLVLGPASDGRAAARHVRRALDYMHARYGEIVTVSDVAEACSASIRTLEASFRELRSQTPFQALTEIRLDAARRLLIADTPPATVTDAAMQCGFGHLGRFSASYRARFDEGPFATLQRSRMAPVRVGKATGADLDRPFGSGRRSDGSTLERRLCKASIG